jgi:glutaredoxin domain-containing cysteine-rich protein 1
LTLDGNGEHNREIENGNARERSVRHTGDRGAVLVSATNLVNERHRASAGTGDGCVRISVYSGDPPAAASDHDRERNNSSSSNNSSVSISGSGGGGGSGDNDSDKRDQSDVRSDNGDMVHRGTTETLNSSGLGGRTAACFYYNNSYQNPLSGMVMSSGQCSPSETLDSGTCSDLDGTPPPLPKKKNASTVILSAGTHNRTGSLTSSGAEVDSDDNESNISCDSLNGAEANGDVSSEYRVHSRNEENHVKATLLMRNTEKTMTTTMTTTTTTTTTTTMRTTTDVEKFERTALANGDGDQAEESEDGLHLEQVSAITETGSFSPTLSANVSRSPSDTSSLSKASSTPRVRSPDPATEQQKGKAVVKECTYEERKQHEHERTECSDADQNQSSGHKYLYEDDRYYNFHVNELREKSSNGEHGKAESDESFAGYKIHQKEAIRSAKGTVRGVKNRVRAGIATFLQTPTSKVCIRH